MKLQYLTLPKLAKNEVSNEILKENPEENNEKLLSQKNFRKEKTAKINKNIVLSPILYKKRNNSDFPLEKRLKTTPISKEITGNRLEKPKLKVKKLKNLKENSQIPRKKQKKSPKNAIKLEKERDFAKRLDFYKDFLQKINLSNRQIVKSIKFPYKIYVAKGNNSELIRNIIKDKWWWTSVEILDENVNFLWTQLKNQDFLEKIPLHYNKTEEIQCENIKEFKENQRKSSFRRTSSLNNEKNVKNSEKYAFTKNPFENTEKNLLPKKNSKFLRKILNFGDNKFFRSFLEKNPENSEDFLSIFQRIKPEIPLTLRSTAESFRIHNHLENNYLLSNKKCLLYNMNFYYKSIEENVFDYLPLTFHIQNGLQDPEYRRFLSNFYENSRRNSEENSRRNSRRNSLENTQNSLKNQQNSLKNPENPLKNPENPLKNRQNSLNLPNLRRNSLNSLRNSSKKSFWIIKPGEQTNRGIGITVCDEIEQIEEILRKSERHPNGKMKTYLIQKYIEKPLLYKKRKFDIRCYMLVTSINGVLKGYWYEEGYIRTASREFTLKNVDNRIIHLTNDAIQKKGEEYGKFEDGNKVF